MEAFQFDAAPPSFQQIRALHEFAVLISASSWLVNSFVTIRAASRDKTPGVPLLALCNNLGYELISALVFPSPDPMFSVLFSSFLIIDMVNLYATIRYTQLMITHSFHRNRCIFMSIAITCILASAAGYWALAAHLGVAKAVYYGAIVCLLLLSASTLILLVERGHTRGASFSMW